MKNLKLVSILLLVASVAVISCSKGTAGPAGPAGPAGTGNVQHSAWVTLAMTEGVDPSSGDTVFTQTIQASSITQNVLDSDLIVSYLLAPGGGTITDVADFSYVLDVEYSVGSIPRRGWCQLCGLPPRRQADR